MIRQIIHRVVGGFAVAGKAGMKKKLIHEYEESDMVVDWLRQNLAADDAVLVKGSHGLRMDNIVAALEVP